MNVFTIILVFIVVLILFTYFYHMYKNLKNKSKRDNRWPPIGSPLPCPDYWVNKLNGVCDNPMKLGLSSSGKLPILPSVDFKTFPDCSENNLNSVKCLQKKCSWARNTNNPWFGVNSGCQPGDDCYC